MVIACLLLIGCDDSSTREQQPSPTLMSTPTSTSTPTPTPTPADQAVYELTQDSRVRLADGTEEVATGSILVSPCFSPNTFFAYRIESVVIVSASIEIRSVPSDRGLLEAVTLYPKDQAVTLSASVLINGAPGQLSGVGPLDDTASGATLDLDLRSASLELHLNAVRAGPPYSRVNVSEFCYR